MLNRAGKERLTLLALAEGTEHLFLEGADAPVVLPAHSPLLQLVQRVRDEAHRFALPTTAAGVNPAAVPVGRDSRNWAPAQSGFMIILVI